MDGNKDSASYEEAYFTYLDSLVSTTTALAIIMAQYDHFLAIMSLSSLEYDVDVRLMLTNLYNEADNTLRRTEALLEMMGTAISQVLLSTWMLRCQEKNADTIFGHQLWSIVGRDIQTLFDSVLSFQSMTAYHAIALHWTTAMSLHLLMSDMLALMISVEHHRMPPDPLGKIEEHRARLMIYTEKILQSIVYIEMGENRPITPFFLATAFQMAIVALGRECETLRLEGGDDAEMRRCENMKGLATRYMDWATQNRIPIKMNVNIPLRRP
jgi:hypothetical protein